jgi:hypothetical protein
VGISRSAGTLRSRDFPFDGKITGNFSKPAVPSQDIPNKIKRLWENSRGGGNGNFSALTGKIIGGTGK